MERSNTPIATEKLAIATTRCTVIHVVMLKSPISHQAIARNESGKATNDKEDKGTRKYHNKQIRYKAKQGVADSKESDGVSGGYVGKEKVRAKKKVGLGIFRLTSPLSSMCP